RGVDQVTKQHGQLAAFGVGTGGCRSWRGRVGTHHPLGSRRGVLHSTTRPDQDAAVLVHGQLFGINEILLEILQEIVVQLQAAFEDAVGEALLLLEEGRDLGQEGIIVHYRPSTCASTASVWGSQKVMSIDWYISRAVESAVRPCSRWPVTA